MSQDYSDLLRAALGELKAKAVGGIGIDVGRVSEIELRLRARRPCLAWIGCWWLAQPATVQRR